MRQRVRADENERLRSIICSVCGAVEGRAGSRNSIGFRIRIRTAVLKARQEHGYEKVEEDCEVRGMEIAIGRDEEE